MVDNYRIQYAYFVDKQNLARMCAISPRPQVIVITAREDLAARATAMQIGPVAFFMKPFDDEEFLSAVRRALSAVPTAQS